MLPLNLQKSVEKLHMSKHQSVSAIPNAESQLDWFWIFFPLFFCKFLTTHIQKIMTTCKIILTPTTKETKICNTQATTSGFSNCIYLYLLFQKSLFCFVIHPFIEKTYIYNGVCSISEPWILDDVYSLGYSNSSHSSRKYKSVKSILRHTSRSSIHLKVMR